MSFSHQLLLALSCLVIATELGLVVYYYDLVAAWISHNLGLVLIPLTKTLIKRLIAFNLLALGKALLFLFWHLAKLLLLKILKSLSIRYGVFFSQDRWYWIRLAKVMFLPPGKQFFRASQSFLNGYRRPHKSVIMAALFRFVTLMFLLGLSFNVTRKTRVQKA